MFSVPSSNPGAVREVTCGVQGRNFWKFSQDFTFRPLTLISYQSYLSFHPRLRNLLATIQCWNRGPDRLQADARSVLFHTILNFQCSKLRNPGPREWASYSGLESNDDATEKSWASEVSLFSGPGSRKDSSLILGWYRSMVDGMGICGLLAGAHGTVGCNIHHHLIKLRGHNRSRRSQCTWGVPTPAHSDSYT